MSFFFPDILQIYMLKNVGANSCLADDGFTVLADILFTISSVKVVDAEVYKNISFCH